MPNDLESALTKILERDRWGLQSGPIRWETLVELRRTYRDGRTSSEFLPYSWRG